jgi:hypothetical protein
MTFPTYPHNSKKCSRIPILYTQGAAYLAHRKISEILQH